MFVYMLRFQMCFRFGTNKIEYLPNDLIFFGVVYPPTIPIIVIFIFILNYLINYNIRLHRPIIDPFMNTVSIKCDMRRDTRVRHILDSSLQPHQMFF